ncbi:hypothetical protein GDO86_002363 [Hymenochirus boettgeri]|uniref:PDZ domain-containing protein n=1 Tax=Hymenochirus boettgeri TaxID=247094 RepID=A0A8T2KJR3_9PIPI|nr:hypothetical protein GDO86_002363 [Hymenochirus boettgeri]
MFPQQPRTEEVIFSSDNESFNPSLWEEQRKQRAQVAFECDEDKDEREIPAREGNLKRYPTPYPDELKNMVKTAQTIVHRKKDEEKAEELKDLKQTEGDFITMKDVGIKTTEGILVELVDTDEKEKNMMPNCIKRSNEPEMENCIRNSQTTTLVKNYWNGNSDGNHSVPMEGSEDLSYDDEMKMAEMRPPLIETSMNQPKVVALSNNKKDDIKDIDSLSDEVTRNSNQNNSNCSSPSRMSDSVSLNTDSSHDISLCSPEKESNIAGSLKIRQEDENLNVLQNGGTFGTANKREITRLPDVKNEEELGLNERQVNYSTEKMLNHNRINKNINNLTCDDKLHSNMENPLISDERVSDNNNKKGEDVLENGNTYSDNCKMDKVNGHLSDETASPDGSEPVLSASVDSVPSLDMCISKSTDDLSLGGSVNSVIKSHSITNIETGALKIYKILDDNGAPQPTFTAKTSSSSAEGQNIVRSKSATLLYDQPLQVFTSSSSSSDLASSAKKTVFKFDSNHNPEGTYTVTGSQMSAVPQYNIQYSNSVTAKDNPWSSKQSTSVESGALPAPRFHISESIDSPGYVKSPANMNFSNHNNVRTSNMYNVHQRMVPRPMEPWASTPNDRVLQGVNRSTLQRQGSVSSNASVSIGDAGPPRRVLAPEGDYMTYRELHSMSRPTHMMPGPQRPMSARAYSIDGPNMPRPQSARPSVNDIPERTMSVSDFNYSRTSPSKNPNPRVNSEHSLIDSQGRKVPHDWREQVLRHIEAKKLEKHPQTGNVGEPFGDEVFVMGQQSYPTIARKESTAESVKKMHMSNGQMCQPSRSQANYSQLHHHPSQGTIGRHPSREQLIDYLVLKVAQQPPYSQAQCVTKQPNEPSQQEVRVRLMKDPELGFSISGGVGGRGNPFRPGDDGIFVTRVQPEGPASNVLQPGDKILQANGYSFLNIDHGQAVALLKTFQNAVELIVLRGNCL